MDIMPINTGHTLIIPKRHSHGLADIDPEMGEKLFSRGMKVAAALKNSGIPCEGVNFFLSDGAEAGQEVFHTHLHVLPRYKDDGFGLRIGPHGRKNADPALLKETAEKIKKGIN